jgi:hypothetical protein
MEECAATLRREDGNLTSAQHLQLLRDMARAAKVLGLDDLLS